MTDKPPCMTCGGEGYSRGRCKSCYGKALYSGEIKPMPRVGMPAVKRGPQQWTDRAACVAEDPDLCFPTTPDGVAAAKEVCAACPVRAACLDFALATKQPFGVWGGLDEDELRSERERRRGRDRRRGARKEQAA